MLHRAVCCAVSSAGLRRSCALWLAKRLRVSKRLRLHFTLQIAPAATLRERRRCPRAPSPCMGGCEGLQPGPAPCPQSPVLPCWGRGCPRWVPAVCRAVAAGGAVCPSACCRRAAGAPLQPPTSQGVADPLQASSFEAVLAYPAP